MVGHRVGACNWFFEALSWVGWYGGVWLAIAVCLALWRRRGDVLLVTVLAVVFADLTTEALKWAISRNRPALDPLVAVPHSHSFPSGHAAISFACATVIGAAVPRARPGLFVLAVLIAWSRVYVGVHYPLDVLAGALWGLAVGVLVLRALPRLAGARLRSHQVPRAG